MFCLFACQCLSYLGRWPWSRADESRAVGGLEWLLHSRGFIWTLTSARQPFCGPKLWLWYFYVHCVPRLLLGKKSTDFRVHFLVSWQCNVNSLTKWFLFIITTQFCQPKHYFCVSAVIFRRHTMSYKRISLQLWYQLSKNFPHKANLFWYLQEQTLNLCTNTHCPWLQSP